MIKFLLTIFMTLLSGTALAQPAADTEATAQRSLSAFMSYTDLRIVSAQQNLEILASTTEARTGEWGKMKELLGGYQRSDDGLIVWYLQPDGSYYTIEKGLMSKSLKDRDYFPDLIAGKKITGALVISKSTGQRSAVIAVPVLRDGKVTGAIGASLFLDRLAERLDSVLELGKEQTFFALAPNGLTTLHRKTGRNFLDPRELGSETLKKAANEMLSGTAGKVTYVFDNATKQAIYRTSPVTQWKFAVSYGSEK